MLRILDENALLVVLVSTLGAALLLLSPNLLVADSWLTLVDGREIVRHGLPSHDAMTVLSHGVRWVDQQWLAQLVYYGTWAVGGVRLAVILNVVLVAAAFASAAAAARLLGASARSVLYVTALGLFVAPWSWQVRAQTLVLPLYVWTIFLLVRDVRRPTRRTFLVFPLLAVWANLHGSAVLAAALVALAGASTVARNRRLSARAAAFLLLPWPCVLASPYALHLPGYYKLMLLDAPFARFVTEWQPARPSSLTAVFYLLAAATVVLAVRQRRRFTSFELSVLAFTLAEAFHAVRGIVWFALAAQVLLPTAVDGALRPSRASSHPLLNRTLAAAGLLASVVALGVAAARSQAWFEQSWPPAAARAVATEPASARVFAADRYADWLLWRVPSLRGRIAYDVRFELLDRARLRSLVDYVHVRGPSWKRAAAGYRLVALDLHDRRPTVASFRAERGARVLYLDKGTIAIVRR